MRIKIEMLLSLPNQSLLQNQSNINFTIYILTLIILTLTGTIVFLIFSKRKLRIKLNKIEQQLTLAQVNPHFIFNSLTAIQSYIFRNDPLQAGKYLSSFAKLIRLILENSQQETITIEQELKILRLYFDIQTLRFEGKFDFIIEVDESIDIDELAIPPLLTQPFIENYIEHGSIQLAEKVVITVRFIKHEKSIAIEVEDNGVGIEKPMKIHLQSGRSHQSHAMEITEKRLKKIWQISRQKIRMEVIDLNTIDILNQGSIVRFTIPIKS